MPSRNFFDLKHFQNLSMIFLFKDVSHPEWEMILNISRGLEISRESSA